MLAAHSALLAAPSSVPPKTESALRARVDEFYGLLVQHKTRAVEALVAQESKDYYYDSQKPDIVSFEIEKITWGPSLKTAEVTIGARVHMMFPGIGPQVVAMKFPSTWKLEHGRWSWYLDKSRIQASPFGVLQSNAGNPADVKPIVTPEMLAAGIRPAKNEISVSINSGVPTKLTFTNNLPGPATLQAPDVKGLKIEIAKPQLAAGESTEVTFTYDGAGSEPRTIDFTALPTHQKIPIHVFFAVQNK